MKELTIIANKNLSDKGSIYSSCHNFTDIYDGYFSNFKNKKVKLLEVGIHNGSSIRMWNEYFSDVFIIALDIDDKSEFNSEKVKTFIIDQSNYNLLNSFSDSINDEFDIIIDDGSHHMLDQQITFYHLFKKLKSGGIYIIEDIHTSLSDNGTMVYGRPIEINMDRKNTTLEFLKNKPYNSLYLNDSENKYLQENILSVEIFDRHNDKVPNDYKNRSITSIIIKK